MEVVLSRRGALLGAACLALAASAGAARAAAGSRAFVLLRGDSPIGEKSVTVAREGALVRVETRIDIAARIFGIPVYRYRLSSSEVWEGGALRSLTSRTDDNGTPHYANADRNGGALRIEGSSYAGPVDGNPGTTTYWSPAFLNRPVWISTQDGRLLNVTATNLGSTAYPTAGGTVEATRWRIGGDLNDLYLFYDAAGEWVGTEFSARGETARFVTAAEGVPLTPLWVNA